MNQRLKILKKKISKFTLLNDGNYKKIGSFFIGQDGEPGGRIPELMYTKDIDGDRGKEIFIYLGPEGAASWG